MNRTNLKKATPVWSFILLAFTIFCINTPPKHSLIGKWSILNLDGTPAGEYINFKKDSTYSITLQNGRIGETGNFVFKNSIFSIKNSKDVCGKNYWGTYRLTFFGQDSVHFDLIKDTCYNRRMDIVGYNPGLRRMS